MSECIQESVTLPADTLRLDKSDSSDDDKTCEDDEDEDAHRSYYVLSISGTEADLFSGSEQPHRVGIEYDELTSDSDSESLPDKQISSGIVTADLTMKLMHCQTHLKGIARTSRHKQSSKNMPILYLALTWIHAPIILEKLGHHENMTRDKNTPHLKSSSHPSNTTCPTAVAHPLKTSIGKGLVKLFGEKDDIIALDEVRDSIKQK